MYGRNSIQSFIFYSSRSALRNLYRFSSSSAEAVADDDEFRVLKLYPAFDKGEKRTKKQYFENRVLPPREKRMAIRNDWPSVWPTAQSFRPSVVPLPLHQGYTKDNKVPPGKYANAELMKIPNFFHLTPPAVKRHCEAIKKFCTAFPKELADDAKCDDHFPVEVITTTYCHSAPTIRDERSRIVTVKVKLDHLDLDYHAKDKLLKLVGKERIETKTNTLVLVADRCPIRKQNYDYLIYVLAAIYHESQIREPWEVEMTEEDQLDFFFEGSRHQKRIEDTTKSIQLLAAGSQDIESDQSSEKIKDYGMTVEKIINHGENQEYLQNYKESVLKILQMA